MSIKRIDSSNDLKNRLVVAGTTGAVLGAGYTATKKNWLYKDSPSDTFVKNVGKELEQMVKPEQRQEASIIRNFVRALIDPEVDLHSLKPQIKASKELSEAVKSNPAEDVDIALERVFAESDKEKLRTSLLELQYKTKSDKLYGKNTALKLIHDNFDSDKLLLRKSQNTSDDVFKMIKSVARKIQVKSVVSTGLVLGTVATAVTLVFSDVDKVKNR